MKAVKARKDRSPAVARGRRDLAARDCRTCTVYDGHARFEAPQRCGSATTVLDAPTDLHQRRRPRGRAADARPRRRPLLDQLLDDGVDFLPEHLVVVGGSYIGLEFAQMYRRFGSEVTVDRDGAAAHRPRGRGRLRRRSGRSSSARASPSGSNAELHRVAPARRGRRGRRRLHGRARRRSSGSHLLLAVGRRPNTDDLGLDQAGVATDARGYIRVDDELRTNVPGIWALGDCNGRGAFTHTSYNDYEIVAANLLDGDPRRVSDRIPAYALYIDPPLGRVGMTEAEARAAGRKVLVGQAADDRGRRAVERARPRAS